MIGYGEQEPGNRLESGHRSAATGRLIYWTAVRPVSGEQFQCAIESPAFEDPSFMERLRLPADEIRNPVSIDRFRDRWNQFLHPDDRVVVMHPSTARLLAEIQPDRRLPLILKAIHVEDELETDDLVERSLPGVFSPVNQSRAQERLALAVKRVAVLNRVYHQTRDALSRE